MNGIALNLPFAKHLLSNSRKVSVIDIYGQLLPIAQQCPSSGGEAVFRTREIIRQVNDSIEYDDASVCLSQGILRTANIYNTQQPCLIVLPNPARDEVEVLLINYREAEFNLRIFDLEGKTIFNSELKNGSFPNQISTEMLAPGVYIVKAIQQGEVICRTKLVIVR